MNRSDAPRGIPSPARTQPGRRSLRWRREQLVVAGYDELSAHRLAADRLVDVHAMVVLKERDDGPAVPAGPARNDCEGSVAGLTK